MLMDRKRIFKYALFAAYAAVMLALLFVRDPYDVSRPYWQLIGENHNFIPFYTIKNHVRLLFSQNRRLVWFAFKNIFGNILLFVPLGFFLPWCFPRLRRLWKTALCVLIIMAAVELLQLFTLRGYADVDDLILNSVGAAVGYGLYRLFKNPLRLE